MDGEVGFVSGGIELAGSLHIPDGWREGQRLPALLVLHGFAGSKDNGTAELMARLFEGWGYAVPRFDFRGCGRSGGRRGQVRPAEIEQTPLGRVAGGLLGVLGILFVPAGVGAIQQFDLLRRYGLALGLAPVVSTLADAGRHRADLPRRGAVERRAVTQVFALWT